MRIHLLSLVLLIAPAYLPAQTKLSTVVQEGLDDLSQGKCQDAMTLWISKWPEPMKSQMAGSCPGLEQYGGKIQGYDVLRVVDVTPHLQRVYVVLLCDIQP